MALYVRKTYVDVLQHLSLPILQTCIIIWNNGCCKKKPVKKPPPPNQFQKPEPKIVKSASSKTSSGHPSPLATPLFPRELLEIPLAPTQPLEEEVVPPNSLQQAELKKSKDDQKKDKEESRKLLPYPEVKPPTVSQKRRRQRELEKDKQDKIASGFYQSRSDEDDTLEKVNSLKEENTEVSRRRSIHVKARDKESDKKEVAKDEKVK